MRSTILTALGLACLLSLRPTAAAQDAAQPAAAATQASQLEAELGKLKDASPEAGELMLQLVDLYHAEGNVFGLVRTGQNFTSNHPSHERHAEVMLKLLDGLQAASRNKETVAICRQFLLRYDEHPACAEVEEILARTLAEMPDRAATAEALAAVWRRRGNTPEGRTAAARGVALYAGLNNRDGYVGAAELAQDVVAKLPPDEFVARVGWRAVTEWQRAGEWAKSNQAAAQLLQKGLPKDPEMRRSLHLYAAENDFRLGQRTNGVAHLKQARAIRDDQPLHHRLAVELYNAGAKAAEIDPVVNEYFQKYPQREDRFSLRAYVALAQFRDGNKPAGLALVRSLLPFDARTHGLASVLVRENGTEPAGLADSERVLLDAIRRNPEDAVPLRWALGLELYRDRMKDLDKARAVIRAMVINAPGNDSQTQQAMYWLLYNPESDQQFAADVDALIKSRIERIHWTGYRGYLPGWIAQAKKNKDHRERAALAKQKFDAAESPYTEGWYATVTGSRAEQEAAMAALLAPGSVEKLTDEQAHGLFSRLASNYYNYGSAPQRARAADVYARMTARFPKDYPAALSYLNAAAAYGPPEVAKQAAEHLLTLPPQPNPNNFDAWYRLLQAADRNQDGDLVRRAWDWIRRCRQQHGNDIRYADSIGDWLAKYEMPDEALANWRQAIPLDYDNYYSRACAERVLRTLEGAERTQFITDLIAKRSDYHGTYAMWLAGDYLQNGDLAAWRKALLDSQAVQRLRAFRGWGIEEYPLSQWIAAYRANQEASVEDKRLVFSTIRDLDVGRASASAALALLELPPEEEPPSKIERLLAYQRATTMLADSSTDWDWLAGYAQAAMARKDYNVVAALVGGMLENIGNVEAGRLQRGRDMVAQSYARMGGVGLAIDENSPVAPLLQAALYLRLGDRRLALDTYMANRALFDEHRDKLPVDFLLFVCESHIAAGGDENHDRAEEILRGWLVKFSEATDLDDETKADVQLMLARNYFKAQRYDVARSEYTTVKNRFPETPQAIEAEFGIGECYMAQKVYDQAEAVFEALAGSRDRDVVIRAMFLRGVLANRRGDRDEARHIFRSVLEMVPNIELANEALFNLSEVYGAEERYIDQLELLRTVGRLGRRSKRWHQPGVSLSIVVYDPDLGTSRGRSTIPVRVTTEPGGDVVQVNLQPTQGGKGLFRADLETRLGQVDKTDRVLQLTGRDVILCDYPEEFKAEFRSVPLSDAEIRVASNGKLQVASSKIVDLEKETFTERIEREAREAEEADQRRSQNRPTNQIKPGNIVYLRVQDADRDLSDEADRIVVKLTATSGDQVRVELQETEPHSGRFEATAQTAELPAGALASDTAIDHNPLMAIDQDPTTFWLSEPDGATPKWLSVDMKDLRYVDRVTLSTPDPTSHAPVRGTLLGSHDGRFWFRLCAIPPVPPVENVAGEFGPMTQRIYAGNHTNYTTWQQVINLTKNASPVSEEQVEQLAWSMAEEDEGANKAHSAVWHGKFFQPRDGAVRFAPSGVRTALVVDGDLQLALGPGNRTVDVWLDRGTHDLTIFAATNNPVQGVSAARAREDHNASQVILTPFRASDFDLDQPGARPALAREPARLVADNGVWDFQFDSYELRYTKLVIDEYLGEAVAINHVEITGEDGEEKHIPTEADILSLVNNQVLEIAAGDLITATYTDEFTQSTGGRSQLLTAELTATYFNAGISPIAFDLVRASNGAINEIRKELIRIDPGEKFVVEIVDYDLDQTGEPDKLRFQVAVNDGEPVELIATENDQFSGIFTKEVLTSATPEEGKLVVKQGDRIYCTYLDSQNTFPGHAVPRETVVYVNEPAEGRVRIVDTRLVRPPEGSQGNPRVVYLPADPEAELAHVAFEVPLTVEVFDRDAAKDSRSTVHVQLETSDGAALEVECEVSAAFAEGVPPGVGGLQWALEEGRFVGQVILQLGSKNSPAVVPLTADMPRNLVGGPVLSEEEAGLTGGNLVTRVLNVTGKDIIGATYVDQRRPDGGPQDLTSRGRLIANGTLACTDRDYEEPVTRLHVGEKLYLRVVDADRDSSDERDRAAVVITTERGEKETVELEETFAHSGVFTGSLMLKPSESPTAGNLDAEQPAIESFFGDQVRLVYLDEAASTESGELELAVDIPVVIGTDGLVAAFSKTFEDETLAVETQFHIAESYFELFKSHKELGRAEEEKADLQAGRRVLREVMEDYPDPKYTPRVAYLLGQFAQELGHWDEAIESYQMIVSQYPEHSLAPDSQFKLAQCYEQSEEFDQALEEYVTLAATYPKSPLIANVMIRISDYFYKAKNYEVAAQVGNKFIERFEGHEWAPKIAFRVGQCYYKDEKYTEAGAAFDEFAKVYPDDDLCADALFWAGESYRLGKNNQLAFRFYNRCRWDHQESEAAKYARGRLALPEMIQQFEAAARELEDE